MITQADMIAPPPDTPTLSETAAFGQKSRRILIVDDQWSAIQRVGPVLGQMGHEVIPALDGATALKRAACATPDLVLLDFLLPDMDGCEVCRRIHETVEGKDIPVIFVSAADQEDFIVRALTAGGVDYITKPFNQAELMLRVGTQLALKSTRDELQTLAEHKDEMLGILTHDLKSSLSGVLMSADILNERMASLNDEAASRMVSNILDPSRRLLKFVQQFLTDAAATHASSSNGDSSHTAERNARILVVDDQPANIQIVGSLLGALGYEIMSATDGPTALKRIAVRAPDLILLDLIMPGMDGLETCRQANRAANGQDVPVIFLSAADDKKWVVRALETGGVDFVTKPFHHAELILRVQTHLALKFSRDRLAQLARERNELLALLAEDLKEQFARMRFNAEELCRRMNGCADTRSFQLAENILHSCAQLVGLVERFTAKGNPDLIINLVPVDLSAMAARTMQRFREPARRKQLTLLMVSSDEAAWVQADECALNEVLDNLVSNAIKFSPPQKNVRLSIRATDGVVECQIQDQGPGFTEEDKAQMFRRYGRLSASPTAGEASTGLGLSIVRHLARAMKGDVTCQSKPGEGATFTVRLPPACSASP